jgi:Family of unknown function (DUF6286)
MHAARRIVSPFLAVFLAALGVFFLVEAIPQLAGDNTPVGANYHVVSTELSRRAWNDWYVVGAGAALLFIGVLLTWLGLHRAPRSLSLGHRSERVRVEFPWRHVRRVAETAALGVDGVAAAKAGGRHDERLTVHALADAPDDLDAQVGDQVRARLAALGLERPPRVRVRVKPAR